MNYIVVLSPKYRIIIAVGNTSTATFMTIFFFYHPFVLPFYSTWFSFIRLTVNLFFAGYFFLCRHLSVYTFKNTSHKLKHSINLLRWSQYSVIFYEKSRPLTVVIRRYSSDGDETNFFSVCRLVAYPAADMYVHNSRIRDAKCVPICTWRSTH